MMYHIKYLSSRPYGLFKKYLRIFLNRLPWQPDFFMELNSLNNNDRGPSKEHFYESLLELAQGLGGEDFLSFNLYNNNVHIGKKP